MPSLPGDPSFSDFRGFFSEDQWFFVRSYRYGFTDNKIYEVEQLLDSAMHDLFTKIQSPNHCLYPLLPI